MIQAMHNADRKENFSWKKVPFMRSFGAIVTRAEASFSGEARTAKRLCSLISSWGAAKIRETVFFSRTEDGIRTEAFDPAKLSDPSLIIYAPVRRLENRLIVSNGDQTDTIYEGFRRGLSLSEALGTREFEPDAPNYTPRISGVLRFADGGFSYELSILKSDRMNPDQCLRFYFNYATPLPGEGHLIHTYLGDGNPLQSFCGEPKCIAVSDELDTFAAKLWDALDSENKISLYVRETDLTDGTGKNYREVLINRNEKEAGGLT